MPHKKIAIISLPTLFLDKTLIAGCIDILKKYLKRLEIKNITIFNKLLIFKGDFLIKYNITKVIY